MYEELLSTLREYAEWADENIYEVPIMLPDTLKKAADAIEELSKQVELEHQSGFADGQIAANRKKPRWIPVTERLPESGVPVLVSCHVKYIVGGGYSYVCDAFYSEHFKEQRSTEYDDIELDYDEETDEYYLPEGWWEVIRNWDEYGFVGIEDFVTHWMPLPQPPTEQTVTDSNQLIGDSEQLGEPVSKSYTLEEET